MIPWIISIVAFGFLILTIINIAKGHDKSDAVGFSVITSILFFMAGATIAGGTSIALDQLKINTPYKVISQCQVNDGYVAITIQKPNGAIRLVSHERKVPEPLFVLKTSTSSDIVVEEYKVG